MEVIGTMSAVTGLDDGKDGKNASMINVAGRSQSSIAAVSIGTVPQLQRLAVAPVCSPNAGRMPGIVGPRYPAVYGAAFSDSRMGLHLSSSLDVSPSERQTDGRMVGPSRTISTNAAPNPVGLNGQC
jgi:hypothetical protein